MVGFNVELSPGTHSKPRPHICLSRAGDNDAVVRHSNSVHTVTPSVQKEAMDDLMNVETQATAGMDTGRDAASRDGQSGKRGAMRGQQMGVRNKEHP